MNIFSARRVIARALVVSLAAVLVSAVAIAAPPRKKSATQPASKPAEPLPPAEVVERFFDLTGSAGLPSYLKCDPSALADKYGISGGQVKTTDTDFFHKDFTFDVVFQFSPTGRNADRAEGRVGIGEDLGRNTKSSDTAVAVDLNNRGRGHEVRLLYPHHDEDAANSTVGKYGDRSGPHLLRMQKKGTSLTFSLCVDFDGKNFQPEFSKTIIDLNGTAPGLTRLNSSLFFAGDVAFSAVRLEVDGKVIDPVAPTTQPSEPKASAGK